MMRIYFARSIRGGWEDAVIYRRIISLLPTRAWKRSSQSWSGSCEVRQR
jgi:hypothetical protein